MQIMADEEVGQVTQSGNIGDITERQDLESDNFSEDIERASHDMTVVEGATAQFDRVLKEKLGSEENDDEEESIEDEGAGEEELEDE